MKEESRYTESKFGMVMFVIDSVENRVVKKVQAMAERTEYEKADFMDVNVQLPEEADRIAKEHAKATGHMTCVAMGMRYYEE